MKEPPLPLERILKKVNIGPEMNISSDKIKIEQVFVSPIAGHLS